MPDKKKLIKEFILNNPSLSATKTLKDLQVKGLGIRKTDFLALFREVKNLPEPSITKREASVPIKYKVVKPKPKPKKIPFEKTRFGKMAKDIQKKHGISEGNAIRRVRKLLKIPRKDYLQLDKIDYDILIQYGY